MFDRILLATDVLEPSQRAANYTGQLAHRLGAAVIVVHVFPHVPRNLGEPHLTQFLNKTLEEAQTILESTAERLRRAGVSRISVDALEGSPVETILEAARNHKPDLLILGARGMGAWHGLLLGSVSMATTQRAEVPVLVVK